MTASVRVPLPMRPAVPRRGTRHHGRPRALPGGRSGSPGASGIQTPGVFSVRAAAKFDAVFPEPARRPGAGTVSGGTADRNPKVRSAGTAASFLWGVGAAESSGRSRTQTLRFHPTRTWPKLETGGGVRQKSEGGPKTPRPLRANIWWVFKKSAGWWWPLPGPNPAQPPAPLATKSKATDTLSSRHPARGSRPGRATATTGFEIHPSAESLPRVLLPAAGRLGTASRARNRLFVATPAADRPATSVAGRPAR